MLSTVSCARVLALSAGALVLPLRAVAQPAEGGQPGTRERQAAAEAYDKGSTAYLAGDYTTAAQWFETAHRMAPNSAALLQATRAYEHAEDLPRAATLALQILQQYSEDKEAVEYAQALIDELGPHLVRIDVECEGCRLELEGKLLEHTSFFVEPGAKHRLVAEFDTGRRVGDVYGEPGQKRLLEIAPPPPPSEGEAPAAIALPPAEEVPSAEETPPQAEPEPEAKPEEPRRGKDEGGGKPFGPLVTWIGVGLTGAGVALSVLSTVDMYGGVGKYEDAAKAATACTGDCTMLEDKAKGLLDDGQAKEQRTMILWIATGGVAAVTATIALFLTDWSGGGGGEKAELRWDVRPLAGGALGAMQGRF